jgi:phosphate-selective porin
MIRSSNMREKLLAAAIVGTFSSQAFSGTVTTDGADIVLKTKGGLEVSTSDKEFSFKLGGRVQADYGRFDGVFTKNGDTADAATSVAPTLSSVAPCTATGSISSTTTFPATRATTPTATSTKPA